MKGGHGVINAALPTLQHSPGAQRSDTARAFVKELIERGCEWLMRSLIVQPEPQIDQRCDRNHNTQWVMRNPATGERVFFSCENDARVWIETRYRH